MAAFTSYVSPLASAGQSLTDLLLAISALQELGSRVVQITDQKFNMFGAANEVRYNIEDEMAS
jgi:hypothetical protein